MTQQYKQDDNKLRLSLVPASLERAVAGIREAGCKKYGDNDNWRSVEPKRYFDAMLRHINAMREHGLYSRDEESGLPHAHHAACNLAFIIELDKHTEAPDRPVDAKTRQNLYNG